MVYIKNNQNNPGLRPLNNKNKSSFLSCLFKESRFRQLTFYILILFLFGLTVLDVYKLFVCYMTDNKEIDFKMNFNASMTMPNITFCMPKNNAWSHFNQTGVTEEETQEAMKEGLAKRPDKTTFLDNNDMWDYKMVMNAYLVVALLDTMEQDTSSAGAANSINNLGKNPEKEVVRETIKKWLNEINKRNVTFDEFRQKVGWETLKRSQHRFERLDVNKEEKQLKNDVKITWVSTRQLCFQPYFDENSFIPINDQEPFFVMTVVYNYDILDDADCMSVDVHGRPSDEARYLEGKGRAKDGVYTDLCIGDVYDALMQVRVITTSLPDPDDPIESRCQIYGEEENGPNSEYECRRKCRLDLIRKICNCTAPSLSNFVYNSKELEQYPICDYEKCDVGNATENPEIINWDDSCGDKCFPDCTQIRYELDVSHKKALHPEELQLTLTWGTFEYLRLIEQERWSFTKFLSQIGGSTGVWLGLSALSIVQFLTFLLTRAHKKVSKRKQTGINSEYNNNDGQHRRSSNDGGTVHEMTNPSNNPLGGGFGKNPFGGGNKRK